MTARYLTVFPISQSRYLAVSQSEKAVGEIFRLNGRTFRTVPAPRPTCNGCAMEHEKCFAVMPECCGFRRRDHQSVIYEEIRNEQ